MISDETSYSRSGDAVCRQVAGETILVPIRGSVADMQRLYALDDTGAFIWDCLESPCTPAVLVRKVVAAFEVEVSVAKRDIAGFLSDLLEHELIQPKGQCSD